MRTPQPRPREVPSHLLSFQVPLLTGTSPAGLCVRIVPPVTERSGQASQGSEQGGPGATGQNDRALRRDSCVPGASEGRPAETESGAPEPRVRGWEPRGPAPSPQHRGPTSCSIRRAIPAHGPWRNFMALHSPRRCQHPYGGPRTLPTASLPASRAAWPCLARSTPPPMSLSTSVHTLGWPSSPGWLALLLQGCWGPRTCPQHTHPISWKRPPARRLRPCRVRGTSVEVTTDALPSPTPQGLGVPHAA